MMDEIREMLPALISMVDATKEIVDVLYSKEERRYYSPLLDASVDLGRMTINLREYLKDLKEEDA